jgi:hypothetical protein
MKASSNSSINIYLENMSHSSLLLQRTVILNGQNHRIRRCYECTAVDSFYHRSKWNLGGECVTMIDERRAIISIPTVQLYTATASKQHLMINIVCNPCPCLYDKRNSSQQTANIITDVPNIRLKILKSLCPLSPTH